MWYISNEITKVQNEFSSQMPGVLPEELAFIYVVLKMFYLPSTHYSSIADLITDGPNDGGIDFVYYDEEQQRVILGQCKYTTKLSNNDIIAELNKMSSTVSMFNKGSTGIFNASLARELQNALDRLPDEDAGNVEYVLFTTAQVNEDMLMNKIESGEYLYSKEMVSIYQGTDISARIQSEMEAIHTVKEDKILIDKAKNFLEYESSQTRGVMVNVKSSSIIALHNKYAERGLFDLNIRRYIRNKLVDSGIKRTLDEEREEFWFYNNGIIFACEDFNVDGDTVKLYGFSIVNGGQTTTLIGKYKGGNLQEFFIPCKIIAAKRDVDQSFYTKIAEATNSQKPIYARDLKANSPEMRQLKKWLEQERVFLEIKRGEPKTGSYSYKIRNDELGQIILSMVYQRPGTSRSGKKAIFENSAIYKAIFMNSYVRESAKRSFIIDIIDLHERYCEIETKLHKGSSLLPLEKDILKNGKQIIFALLGILYSLSNGDIKYEDIHHHPHQIRDVSFVYGPIIGYYKLDDLDEKLTDIIILLVQFLAESYEKARGKEEVTSISNYFKTDKKYYEDILKNFAKVYNRQSLGRDLQSHGNIFIRTGSKTHK